MFFDFLALTGFGTYKFFGYQMAALFPIISKGPKARETHNLMIPEELSLT